MKKIKKIFYTYVIFPFVEDNFIGFNDLYGKIVSLSKEISSKDTSSDLKDSLRKERSELYDIAANYRRRRKEHRKELLSKMLEDMNLL